MSEEDVKIVWGHSGFEGAERWHDACSSKEEAIVVGRGVYGHNVEFYVMRGEVPLDGFRFMPTVDFILEQVAERASDEVGEASEDWPDVNDEGKLALEKALRDWASEHLHVEFWIASGTVEKIEALVGGKWLCRSCGMPDGYAYCSSRIAGFMRCTYCETPKTCEEIVEVGKKDG